MSSLYERNKALKNRVSASDFSLSKEDIDKAWERGGQRQLDVVAEYRKKQEEEDKKKLETKYSGSTISAPKTQTSYLSQPTKTRGETIVSQAIENQRSMGAPIRDFARRELGGLGRFFFGESEEKFRGHTLKEPDSNEGFVESFRSDINTRGIIRTFTQNLFKEDKEKIQEGSFDLVKQGYTRNEAVNLATKYYEEGDASVPENVSIALKNNDIITKAWASVELLDAYPVFKKLTQTGGRVFLRDTLTKAMLSKNALESRKILSEAFPQIKGTQELEDLISYTRTVADPQKGEEFLAEVMRTAEKTPITSNEAQRVFYDNGIPLVRGGEVAPTTVRRGGIDVPSQTKDAMALRKEINDVLAGQAEQARLSNLDVFADEIKAGALPFKASVDDKVKMYVSDAIKDVTRLRAGDRLATAKEVLEDTLDAGKAKLIEVNPSDVVRLSDGTFTYAPKDVIGKGVQATLRSVRASQRAKLAKIAKSKETSKLRKEIGREADEFNTELAKREAAKRAEREQLTREVAEEAEFFNKTLARRESAAQAKKTLAELGERKQKLIDEITDTAKASKKEIREKAKEVNKAVKEAGEKLRKTKEEIGKIPNLIAKERAKAREAIKRINNLKTVSVKEKAKRRAKVIKERDKEIARLTKEKTKLQAAVPKVKKALDEAEAQVFDKDAAIRKVEQKERIQKASVRKDTKATKAQSEQTLKEVSKPLEEPKPTKAKKQAKPQTPTQKARAKNTKEVKTLTSSIKESFTITEKTIPDTISSPISPVKGEGKTVESQIIKGLQDEIEVIKKNFEERGLSLADLPDTHKAIGNPALMKQAFADLVEDPAKVYSDFISGVLPEGTTRAAYALALMKSDFVLGNPSRMDMVARAFYKGNTRIGQELQSIKVFGRMDYLNIVGRFSKQADDILKARGVDVEKEAKELLKKFGDEFDQLGVASKDDAVKVLDEVTCKV